MKKKHNRFAVLTEEIATDNRLDAYAKILFAEITTLTKISGLCWASNRYFATRVNCSEKTISRRIKTLVDTGYIYVRQNEDKQTRNKTKRLITLMIDEMNDKKVMDSIGKNNEKK